MTYPSDLSRQARARIVNAKIKARQVYLSSLSDPDAFPQGIMIHYVMVVFAAFATEACSLARAGIWGVDRVEDEVSKWIYSTVIFAEDEVGIQGERFRHFLTPIGTTVKSEVLATLKQEPQWKQYEEELLTISVAQGIPGSEIEYNSPESPISIQQPRLLTKRGKWLKERLREREWSANTPCQFGGPDHKTVKRILNGLPVHDGSIDKLLTALNKIAKLEKLGPESIPSD